MSEQMTNVDMGHVLLTDDSLTVRMMLKHQLEEQGYQVSLCESGEECVEFLEYADPQPDLVMLDLVMPGIDGIKVLQWIKGRPDAPFLPVILLTALGDVGDRVRGLDQGADDYIAKPFERDELLARVRAQFRIKRLQDELERRNDALEAAHQEKDRLLSELEAKNAQLGVMATTDPLTGVANRGHIEQELLDETARSRRYGAPLSVAMVDIDHFKVFNDTYGHPFGDKVIRAVSRVLSETVREIDMVGRYGGEEFLLVLPGTDQEGGLVMGERIRAAVAALELELEDNTGGSVRVTLSCGVAGWLPDSASWEDLVSEADQALYEAKESGRNRVCAYQSGSGKSPSGHGKVPVR